MAATAKMKEGEPCDLLARLAAEPAFGMTEPEMAGLLDPALYIGRCPQQVDALLEREGIQRDGNLDYTCGLFDDNWDLVATGSAFGPTLRCFAVDHAHQGEGLLNEILTHLVERQAAKGNFHLFLYTKPENEALFTPLLFYSVARTDRVLLMEENFRSCAQIVEAADCFIQIAAWAHTKKLSQNVDLTS